MINHLIQMYEHGALTAYQVMIDSLHMVDPDDPSPVLAELPDEILDEMLAYARRYDPRRPRSLSVPLPAEDQVRSVERWIGARRAANLKPVAGAK